MHRASSLTAVTIAAAIVFSIVGFASPVTSKVVIFLPPETAMGVEFVELIEAFDEQGVAYDVVSAELGPYLFWEDSGEGKKAYADLPRGWEWTIRMTYDDVNLSDYDVLIFGPGFAHTFWTGESLPKAEALLQEAFDAGMPIGGVSYGAMFLIQNGYLDGRTTARPPLYQGVVSEERHRDLYLSTWAANYGTECIHVDYGVGGIPTIITANYRCVTGFAKRIVTEFLSD